MFARKLRLTLLAQEEETLVPKDWLDHFFMRDFTGHSAFDETLAVSDGLLEAGFAIEIENVRTEFEKWLRGRRMIPPGTGLKVSPYT